MNIKLKVKSGITANAYSSFEEAVASSKKELENYDEIRGNRVTNIEYASSAIAISFENTDFVAVISINDNRIDCNITKEIPDSLSATGATIPDQVKLDCSGVIVDWNRELFFAHFVGKIIALSPSDQYLFLFVKGGADYMCQYLIDENKIYAPFLYLSEY